LRIVRLFSSKIGCNAIRHFLGEKIKLCLINSLKIVDHIPANSRCASWHRVSPRVTCHAINCSRNFWENRAKVHSDWLTKESICLPAEEWIWRSCWIQLEKNRDRILATCAEKFTSIEIFSENLHLQVVISWVEGVLWMYMEANLSTLPVDLSVC
jgi:hypothetical protein